MTWRGSKQRGYLVIEAMLSLTIIGVACLLVYLSAATISGASRWDLARRQCQDILEARAFAWRTGGAVAVETGSLPCGTSYRFTPEVVTGSGADQLRMEIIWSDRGPLPGSSLGWPYRVTAMAVRIP